MKKTRIVNDFIVKKSEFENWESAFIKHPSVEVETLKTGMIVSKVSGLLNLNSKNSTNINDGIANIPVLAHIIRHEKYGDYLIDTGFDSSFSKEFGGNFKGIIKKMYFKNRYFQIKSSQGIEIQLEEKGIKLKGVFLTHMHEHVAGAPSLPNEIPYICGRDEHEINFFPFIYSRFLKNKTNIQKIDFSLGQDMPIFGKGIDIFGDGSFWAVPTPGHTKGHISYIVNGKDKISLITGDVCITRKGFELGVETGKFSSNIKEGKESFFKIKEFVKCYPFIRLIFGHETDEYKIDYI